MKASLSVLLLSLIILSCKNKESPTDSSPGVFAKKPNIVFILVDDMGLHDLSITGSDFYETPNIDRIAKEGTVFTQGYAASRVCSPARASIMTGKFTARHGITNWIGEATGKDWRKLGRNDKLLPADYVRSLPKKDTSLAEAMRGAGYKTFFAGKWHLGEEGSYPEDHGFEINKGGWEVGSPIGGYFSPWENPRLSNGEKGENLSMRLARETSDFMAENKDESFFAFLSFYAVHGPIQTTETKWEKYRDKAEQLGIKDEAFRMERVLPIRTVQDNPIYAGLVEQMDDAVGLVLDKLQELGIADNTIVVFTSDNGGVASGDSFSTSNLPLRGGKGYQWEGGIREPFFIKVPWMKNAPKSIDEPVTGTDFYPTLLDFANTDLLTNQHKDGISLKPLLEGKEIADRNLFWHYPHYGNQGGEPSSMFRKKDWKLIHYYEDGRDELYNLKTDPGEQNDVAAQNPGITSKMRTELEDFLNNVGAKKPEKDPVYDPELAKELYAKKVNELLPKLEAERKNVLSEDFSPNKDWWNSKLTED
ncbi:Arylsulfatase A [Salegentibacter holothuriorum]|uniref:Arylsulfatase A n=1 Tax=Salegentibacter holothuriorum TaxID=241145 RepID=A0A1T5E9R9_9FLAO|nr:sulfatase [Salegentibacter holothuriorum]SKB80529.1 Arylsulfatase A [Salegentibacter holothuriorum]